MVKTFSDKLRESRTALKLSQQRLAELIGVSARSVIKYEVEGTRPRKAVMERLAAALKLSPEYLSNDSIVDPRHGIEGDGSSEIFEIAGAKAGKELEFLLRRSNALFAGGELSQEAKDEYFEAVMTSYLRCKEVAKRKRTKV